VGVTGDGPVLVTGAAGLVGTLLRTGLVGMVPLRLTDVRPVPGAGDDQVVGDLADPAVADAAVRGVHAVIHLAAYPRPDAPWTVLARANLETTATLLDAAGRHGVRTLVYASSVHAAGGYGDPAGWPVRATWPTRPCCRYGVSKAAGEALLDLHARRHPEVSAVALRLGLVADRPRWSEEVKGWTPSSDVPLLMARALEAGPGFRAHFAVADAEHPRYATEDLRTELGYRSVASERLTEPLGEDPPTYFDGCDLWGHPAFVAWLRQGRPDRPVDREGAGDADGQR
jgi:nucleoside-diphosphate-sugar epimerase